MCLVKQIWEFNRGGEYRTGMAGSYFPQDTCSFWFWTLRLHFVFFYLFFSFLLVSLRSVEFEHLNYISPMKHEFASLGLYHSSMFVYCRVPRMLGMKSSFRLSYFQ